MVVIVDYGMGNLHSVKKAFDKLQADVVISSDPAVILHADKLILPGVGHFGKAIENISALGILDALNEAVLVKRTPILGICLGMQLMAQGSEEGDVKGLGWFDASVVRFKVEDPLRYKIPHIGWNTAPASKESPLTSTLDPSAEYYFIHSYHLLCKDPQDILTTTEYAYPFASSISKGNMYGVQFHPEKSHQAGLQLLKNFLAITN